MTLPEDIRAAAWKVADQIEWIGDSVNISSLEVAIAEALMAERKAENQRWKDLDETARESGLLLSPFDLAEAVMNERERCARIVELRPDISMTPRANMLAAIRLGERI